MKKGFKAILALSAFLLFLSLSVTAFAETSPSAVSPDIKDVKFNLIYNGSAVNLSQDNLPISVNGRTLLPLDAMFKIINSDGNADFTLNGNEITITKGGKTVRLVTYSAEAEINGASVSMDGVEPVVYNNKVYVPYRFLADNFGFVLNWSPYDSTSYLADAPRINEIADLLTEPDLDAMEVPLSYKGILGLDASFNISGLTGSLNSKTNLLINADLKNKFMYLNLDGNANIYLNDLSALGLPGFLEAKNTTEAKYSFDFYDDGESSYFGSGDDYTKSISSLASMEGDMLNQLAGPNFMETYEQLKKLIGYDNGWYAGMSKSSDENGNIVIEGPMVMPETMISNLMNSMYGSAAYGFDPAESGMSIKIYPVYCKYVLDKDSNKIKSSKATFNMDIAYTPYYGESQSISLKMDIDMNDVIYNASFSTVVPEAVKAVAFDPYEYYNWEEYEDFDLEGYEYESAGFDPESDLLDSSASPVLSGEQAIIPKVFKFFSK